jgi:methyl-accepting chemotaxis protein
MARDAISSAGSERLLLLSGVGLAIVVSTGIMIAIARAIGRPIVGLTTVMTAMAGGDLEQEVPALDRGDEIGAMACAVDVFRRNGRQAGELANEREQAAKQRRQTAMEYNTADFGASISDVMAALDGSAEAMRHAAAAMTDAVTQVSGRARTTATGAAKASLDLASVAGAIEQLTASVDEISRQVASAATIARQAVRSAEAGQDTMRTMADAASRIGEVVRLISAIAGQTNMLALNATIEAARAGESGRGFAAVVAVEVKTLAARTAKATSDIDSQISAVSGSAEAALAAMAEVSAIIGKMDEVSGAIAAAVEQQTATTRELAFSLQAVASATDQTAHAMQEVAGVAGNAGGVSREVRESADAIGREAQKLRSKVDGFLIAVCDDGGGSERQAA